MFLFNKQNYYRFSFAPAHIALALKAILDTYVPAQETK